MLRGSDLTRLMVTLGVALVLGEVANQASWLTGGADGLQGISMGPILGLFEFDIFGTTAYAYSLAVTFLLFILARRIVVSPFGLSLRSIRDNPLRARAVGIPVNRRLVAIYTLAAAYAGVAGALLAQTTQFVSLDVLAFHRSADVMLVLVIGGVGYLYGGLIGAIVFKVLQDVLSAWTPQYWQFWIGLILVVIVLAGRERLTERVRTLWKGMAGRTTKATSRCRQPPLGRSDMAIALETKGLVKRFGGLQATDNVSFRLEQGARHALIGPNGAGKTTFINLLTGVLKPTSGQILLEGQEITGLRSELRVQRGLARTFQINQLFPAMTPLETIGLAVSERLGGGRDWWRVDGQQARDRRRDRRDRAALPPHGCARRAHVEPALRQAAASGDRRRLRLPAARAPARRAGCRRAGSGAARTARDGGGAAAGRLRPSDRARHGSRLQLRRPHLGAGQRRAVHGRHGRGGLDRPAGARRLSRGECR